MSSMELCLYVIIIVLIMILMFRINKDRFTDDDIDIGSYISDYELDTRPVDLPGRTIWTLRPIITD